MYKFAAVSHNVDICVECGIQIPETDPEINVTVILEGDVREVPGLLRCVSCAAWVELGTIRSAVDLKGAHAWLTERFVPMWMIRATEIDAQLRQLAYAGMSKDAVAAAAEAMEFLKDSGEIIGEATGLADALNEHFGIGFNPDAMRDAMARILKEEQPVYSEDELNGLIAGLDLRREPNGEVTYACPNPTCPADGDRHPLSFAEPILTDQVVEALIGRLPE